MARTILNVGGVRYETTWDTLLRLPNTKLGAIATLRKNKGNDNGNNNEEADLFFDRSPEVFNFILDLYRTGQLHLPTCVCGATIKNELEYWEIPRDMIERCCLQTYYKYENDKDVLDQIEKSYEETTPGVTGKECFRKSVWRILHEPRSSRAALVSC